MLLTVIVFVIVLGVLIFVHELGHFITAKRAGLTVEEFGFGFPPRLMSIRRGGTRYSLNLIPFGGFVRILGESGEEQDNPKSFAGRAIGVRALVVAAGILMNFLLAVVLLTITNATGMATALEPEVAFSARAAVSESRVTVTLVEAGSPADETGLRPGDSIVAVAGEPARAVAETVQAISSRAGQAVPLTVKRGQEQHDIMLTPRISPPDGQGPIGIQLVATATVRYPWYWAPVQAVRQTVILSGQIFVSFWHLVVRLVQTGSVGSDVAGPVGIAVMTGQVLDLGFVPLLQFTALLSINLAIINVLPFPALDGGRLLFFLIEKTRRKKISQKVEQALHTLGFGLLIALILLVTVRDVLRLL
ncbi:MAG: RIP metalloprotease RseP [Parcubacteria group bacterium]